LSQPKIKGNNRKKEKTQQNDGRTINCRGIIWREIEAKGFLGVLGGGHQFRGKEEGFL